MSETANLALPLLAAAQAQKHVTVNEALVRLDAAAQGRALSADLGAPPVSPGFGDAYLVAAPASGDWAGRAGALAFHVNDGWSFAQPRPGWRVWVEDRGEAVVFDGAVWRRDPLGPVRLGAASQFALIVTAEPHFAVSAPSTMVVMYNVADKVRGAETKVSSLFERADYSTSATIEPDERPVELVQAEYSVAIVIAAGAEQFVPNQLYAAQSNLDAARAGVRWELGELRTWLRGPGSES